MERQDLDTFRTSFKKPFLVRSAMNERTGAARPLSLPALAVVGVEPGASFAGERIAGPLVTEPRVFPDRNVIVVPGVGPRVFDFRGKPDDMTNRNSTAQEFISDNYWQGDSQ